MKNSGLYDRLVDNNLLIPHEEVDVDPPQAEIADRVIKPKTLAFISYPYEWCFGQLRDAALTTLAIQKQALDHGMILRDASAYNIQFEGCRPVFIDTLSFARYEAGRPWVAYQQFCQHFLAPLALMSYNDIRLGQLMRVYIDGIPLDLASSLLPRLTWLSLGLGAHIHLHAKSQKRYADRPQKLFKGKISKHGLMGHMANLEAVIRKLRWKPNRTVWTDYYADASYDDRAMIHKRELVAQYLEIAGPTMVWDLGGNIGRLSRIASEQGRYTVSFDLDGGAVEQNYQEGRLKNETRLLPLILDLTNPSPAIGWANRERMSLADRGPTDTIMALALIHHLAIGNNVPFRCLAEFLRRLCRTLIIEFIPKTDSQVQRLLASREDIFSWYTQEKFKTVFSETFSIERQARLDNSERTLYLMRNRRPD